MKRRAVGPWAWILGLQLLLVLPFIGQPLHIDDPIYLDIGRHALKDPLHAEDFPYIFEGVVVPDMASHSHPPFVGYWIGLLLKLAGDGPQLPYVLHLGFLIFPLLFAAGMYLLALRFTALPDMAAAVAITSPAAIVMSHMLMTDIPTLAFSTLGMALYVKGVDEGKTSVLWVSGVLLALASFCSYPAILLSGVCWFYAALKRARLPAALVSPAIPLLWMAAWLTLEYIHFGRFVIGETARYVVDTHGFSAAVFANKIFALPIFLSAAVLLLPITLLRESFRGIFKISVALIWGLLSVALAQSFTANYSMSGRVLVALFLTLGGWIILGLTLRILRSWSGDTAFLALWLAAALAPVLLIYTSGMARYLLPLLPPMVLIAFLKLSPMPLPAMRSFALVSILFGLVLGLLLSAADFDMARIHREAAESVGHELNGWKDQTRFGAEWGLRHYLLEQGIRQYTTNATDLQGGSFLISPTEAVPYAIPQDVGSMLVPVSRTSWTSNIPIRLMNQEAHAGFYSSNWGLLPYSFSRAPVETIDLKQVSYLVEKLPESTFESADGGTITPLPAPGGGVDLVIPANSKLAIPYTGPFPARVQFECASQNADTCPLHVKLAGSEIPLSKIKGTLQFDLTDSHVSEIVLQTASPVTIRNWLMLPGQ